MSLLDETPPEIDLSAERDCRVLLLIRDDSTRAKLAALASMAGYDVDTAASAAEALRLHRIEPFDIVLADWLLSSTDALDLCRNLREHGRVSGYVYLVIVSSRHSQCDMLVGLASGADDIVFLDGDPDEMFARVAVGRRIMQLERALRKTNERNYRLAMTDGLTQTHNHRYLMTMLPKEIAKARQCCYPLAVLCCDIDRFKLVNDQYGHHAGDEVLRQFAIRSRGCLREPSDWIARSGGEEFVIVMPETDMNGAAIAASRGCRAFHDSSIPAPAGRGRGAGGGGAAAGQ